MTIIKTKTTKEIIDNIKKEQQENRLNWEQKADDWEQRHILQSELLNQVEKDLEQKVLELEVSKEEEKITRETYVDLLTKKDEKIRMLEEKDESQQISLLKEQHEKEIVKLERSKRTMEDSYYRSICDNLKDADTIKELEKELEEKELLIEQLKQENKKLELGRAANLSAIRVAVEWEKRESKKIENELGQKIGILENAGNEVLVKLYEESKKSESQKKYIEELEKKFYEQGELLRKELEKTTSQKAEIDILQEQVDLTNELYLNKIPLPKIPSKFKIFKEKTKTKLQNLVEKTKHRSQELIARIEAKVK